MKSSIMADIINNPITAILYRKNFAADKRVIYGDNLLERIITGHQDGTVSLWTEKGEYIASVQTSLGAIIKLSAGACYRNNASFFSNTITDLKIYVYALKGKCTLLMNRENFNHGNYSNRNSNFFDFLFPTDDSEDVIKQHKYFNALPESVCYFERMDNLSDSPVICLDKDQLISVYGPDEQRFGEYKKQTLKLPNGTRTTPFLCESLQMLFGRTEIVSGVKVALIYEVTWLWREGQAKFEVLKISDSLSHIHTILLVGGYGKLVAGNDGKIYRLNGQRITMTIETPHSEGIIALCQYSLEAKQGDEESFEKQLANATKPSKSIIISAGKKDRMLCVWTLKHSAMELRTQLPHCESNITALNIVGDKLIVGLENGNIDVLNLSILLISEFFDDKDFVQKNMYSKNYLVDTLFQFKSVPDNPIEQREQNPSQNSHIVKSV